MSILEFAGILFFKKVNSRFKDNLEFTKSAIFFV